MACELGNIDIGLVTGSKVLALVCVGSRRANATADATGCGSNGIVYSTCLSDRVGDRMLRINFFLFLWDS